MRSAIVTSLLAIACSGSFVACSSDDDGADRQEESTAPTSAPTTETTTASIPPVDPVAVVSDCLTAAGLETDPEDGPRFGALVELQVDVATLTYLGVFIYPTSDAAAAAQQVIVDAGAADAEIAGTVVLAGATGFETDHPEGVAAIRACAAATAG